MEPRARRQALRLHLAEARSALDRGDIRAAREAVSAALELDPHYLAAQTLRDRLAQSPAAEPPPPPVPVAPPLSVAPSEGWARFEQRAMQRRLEKRAVAARHAIAAGRLDEARTIMSEISEIDAAHPELISLQMELDAASAPQPRHRFRWGRASAALVAFGTMLLGARYLDAPRSRLVPQSHVEPPVAVAVLPSVALASARQIAPISVDTVALRDTRSAVDPVIDRAAEQRADERPRSLPVPASRDVVAPVAVHAPIWPPPQLSAARSPVVVDAASASGTSSSVPAPAVSAAEPSGTAPPTPPQLSAPAGPPPSASLTNASLPARTESAAVATTSVTPPRLSEATIDTAATQPRDEDLVRRVLQQYRLAYEHLDARSAAAVWPRVDSVALQRAFEGLASQRLTFDACDVQVRATGIGTAVCRGSTRYVPKVGSREARVEPRVWTFGLRKIGDDWRIDTARAEQ